MSVVGKLAKPNMLISVRKKNGKTSSVVKRRVLEFCCCNCNQVQPLCMLFIHININVLYIDYVTYSYRIIYRVHHVFTTLSSLVVVW